MMGHFALYDRPDQIARLIDGFLAHTLGGPGEEPAYEIAVRPHAWSFVEAPWRAWQRYGARTLDGARHRFFADRYGKRFVREAAESADAVHVITA